VEAVFKTSHPDCKPLGDVRGTVELLRITHPEIVFEYVYEETKS
jgi:hypothetical protein